MLALSATSSAVPLRVVSTFSILADWVQVVGGEHVEQVVLVGADSDAHVFEPRPVDVRAVASADLVVINGLNFEGWLERLVQASGSAAHIVVASQRVEPVKPLVGAEVLPGVADPHAWHNVGNAEIYVQNIVDALCVKDADNCEYFRARATQYQRELKRLDTDIRTGLAALPFVEPVVVTNHDAFGHFAATYGVRFITVKSLSTEAHASARDLARIISLVRKHGANGIFIENVSDQRLLQQIARETSMVLGGALFSDALSQASGPAGSYILMMRHNLQTLLNGMQPRVR